MRESAYERSDGAGEITLTTLPLNDTLEKLSSGKGALKWKRWQKRQSGGVKKKKKKPPPLPLRPRGTRLCGISRYGLRHRLRHGYRWLIIEQGRR